jgi:hypothetical protein
MGDVRTVLSLVQADRVWRVQITWANGSKHRIGKAEHRRRGSDEHPEYLSPHKMGVNVCRAGFLTGIETRLG